MKGYIKGKYMQFRRFVKILMLGLLGLALSNLSFAEQLRCEQDFPKIKRMLLQEKNIYDRGSFEELLKYYQRTEYSELFTANHPGQKFLYNVWIEEEYYKGALKEAFETFQMLHSSYKTKIGQPQQNFIIDDQELCLFPVMLFANNEFDEPLTDEMTIFVRKLGSDKWRVLTLNQDIKEQDFREFFPNFPKNVAIKELDYTH